MKRRTFVMSGLAPAVLAACGGGSENALLSASETAADVPGAGIGHLQGTVRDAVMAMRRAVQHMDENVSYNGGYVWDYLPDLSRTWGEMEAKRTMCWIQPPGTPSVGHALIDAFHASGDPVIYAAARRTALALVAAQHPAGGWNYIHDFAGEASLKDWYETIGRNGWRLEEFQHYYGNATFDDAGTAVASQVLLRMYLEKRDKRFEEPLNKAIQFVLDAQFKGGIADGGWPQRFPAVNGTAEMPAPNPEQIPDTPGVRQGMEDGDYTRHVTFNDDVAGENIKFLLMCVVSLGRTDLIEPVQRAMQCLKRLQYREGAQSGWGLQHLAAPAADGRPAGAPAGARSYEPRSLATHTTQTNIQQLFNYFRLTGDRHYLDGVPSAIDWLASVPLSDEAKAQNPLIRTRTHPTFVELGTNKALFVHRYGSNIHNGAYYVDYSHLDTPSHYSAGRNIDIAGLRKTYAQLMAMTEAQIADMVARSPLKATTPRALPRYFSLREVDFADLFAGSVMASPTVSEAAAQSVINDLGDKNYWLTALSAATNRYIGDGPSTPYTGTAYQSKHVGDRYDTSPYDPADPPLDGNYTPQPKPQGISTTGFVSNLGKLIAYVAPVKA
ncbi:pectate lyase [Azohydromonas caseinilytica]|uniref:Pectate lyase n=1 Tax=Azohydromonas caseinilytica TaxID=2728836 RepID=A0A848FHG8_9BURK|nr:pectate lyase [Azohydromonas caseinilytica]NML17703.1 pectate lyase [Azohydromonas caseinilytica]